MHDHLWGIPSHWIFYKALYEDFGERFNEAVDLERQIHVLDEIEVDDMPVHLKGTDKTLLSLLSRDPACHRKRSCHFNGLLLSR